MSVDRWSPPGPLVDLDRLTDLTRNAVAEVAAQADATDQQFDDQDRQQYAQNYVAQLLGEVSRDLIRRSHAPLTATDRKEITGVVLRRAFSLLPELQAYLERPDVTDVHINGWDDVRIELMDGSFERGRPFKRSDAELEDWIQTIARRAGREKAFNPANPRMRTRLADGSRFTAVSWISDRPYVSIRCHRHTDNDLADLQAAGMIDYRVRSLLTAAVRARLNIMVAGEFGVGKTTLMRAMLHEGCEPDERIVVMEEEPELQLAEARPDLHNQVLCFGTRDANTEGQGAYEFGDLSKTVKWFKPRRIVVGEVQGAEVIDMLEAVTSGQGGSICTIHADSSAAVMDRLVMYAEKGGMNWSVSYILRRAAASLKLIVYVSQTQERRKVVSEIRQVAGYDPVHEQVITNEIFIPGADGAAMVNPASQISGPLRQVLERHGYLSGSQAYPNGAHRR